MFCVYSIMIGFVLLMIHGPSSVLEAEFHSSFQAAAPRVLLFSPHPERDGDMHHKVIYTLYRVFASLKFDVLRFNFRGCGKSEGTFSDGEEEVADAAVCLEWLNRKRNVSTQPCWVVGFSFGAWVAMQLLMRRPECKNFVIVNPPVSSYDFSFLAPCPSSGLIIYGEKDPFTSRESIVRFVHQLSSQRRSSKTDENLAKNPLLHIEENNILGKTYQGSSDIKITLKMIAEAGAQFSLSEHLSELFKVVNEYILQKMQQAQPSVSHAL